MAIQFPRMICFSAIPPRSPSKARDEGEALDAGVAGDGAGEFERFFWRYESGNAHEGK